MKRWTSLLSEITLTTGPTAEDVKRWTHEKMALETECVGELRALCFDCENIAASVMGLADRQREIKPLQRFLIHFGTFQRTFPVVKSELAPPDLRPSTQP